MKKRTLIVFMVFLLVVSIVVSSEVASGDDNCGKVCQFFNRFLSREGAVVGKAAGIF